MNKQSRLNLIKILEQEQNLNKTAQEIVDSVKGVDGEKIADEIFKKILDGINIEELENEI
jgi:hypothetical protein